MDGRLSIARSSRDSAFRPPRPASMGDALRLLEQLGRNYVATIRALTLVPTFCVAVLAAWGTPMVSAVLAVMAGVTAWSAVFCWQVRRSRRPWIIVGDVVVLGLLALTTASVVPPHWLETGKSWLLPFVSFAAVVLQYYAGVLAGAVSSAVLAAAMTVGTVTALPPGASSASIVTSVYVLVLSALGRILWTLVKRGGRMADEAAAELESALREKSVASAVRDDERELANALHDTAAATLMMVGQGQVGAHGETLRRRAHRDLEVLRTWGERRPDRIDVVGLLREAIDVVPLRVDYDGAGSALLPADVAHALGGATAEALNNIVKHANVESAEVKLLIRSSMITITVSDQGGGFDSSANYDDGHGVRESMIYRMESVKGACRIDSHIGCGTVVALEWTDD